MTNRTEGAADAINELQAEVERLTVNNAEFINRLHDANQSIGNLEKNLERLTAERDALRFANDEWAKNNISMKEQTP